jgi:hypothetical protein
MFNVMEVDLDARLAFGKPTLQLFHRRCVVLRVIECKVADL